MWHFTIILLSILNNQHRSLLEHNSSIKTWVKFNATIGWYESGYFSDFIKINHFNIKPRIPCIRCDNFLIAENEACGSLQQPTFSHGIYIQNSQFGLDFLKKVVNDKLKVLTFQRCKLSDEMFDLIASNQSIESLQFLSTKVDGKSLAKLGKMKNLKNLMLRGTSTSDTEIGCLSDFASLEAICLSNTQVSNDTLSVLLSKLASLKCVELIFRKVDNRLIDKITSLKNLEVLAITGADITHDMIKSISKVNTINFLDLSENRISNQFLEEIQSMQSLSALVLRNTGLTNASIPVIAKIKNLSHLSVSYNRIDDKGVSHLKSMEKLTHFEAAYTDINGLTLHELDAVVVLELFNCNMNVDAISIISKLPCLKFIDLTNSYSQLDNKNYSSLLCSPNLSRCLLVNTSLTLSNMSFIHKNDFLHKLVFN
ncbi:MAG: hypothetical protein R3B84_20225 [Zavarzinella sp.]